MSNSDRHSQKPDPYFPPLSNLETRNAIKELVIEPQYTKVVRSNVDDGLSNQVYGMISFNFFDKPQVFPNSKKPIYGFAKLRGSFPDQDSAKKRCAEIIRGMDSVNKIKIVDIGHWFPITEDDQFDKEQHDIKTREQEEQNITLARDSAAKDKEKKDEEIIKELRENEEKLKNNKDPYDDKTSIEYYTLKKNTDMKLIEQRDIDINKLKSLEEKLLQVRTELKDLDKKFPTHTLNWLKCYNNARAKSGLPDFIPSKQYTEDYEKNV